MPPDRNRPESGSQRDVKLREPFPDARRGNERDEKENPRGELTESREHDRMNHFVFSNCLLLS